MMTQIASRAFLWQYQRRSLLTLALIEQAEVMGYSAHNNALDDIEMDVTGDGLDGTRLIEPSDDGSTSTMKSPNNRRKKKFQLNEQLSNLTKTLDDGNKELANAVNRLVDKIDDGTGTDPSDDVNRRTTALEADISDVRSDVSTLKRSVENLDSNIQTILSILQGGRDDLADADAPPVVTPRQSTGKKRKSHKSPPPPRMPSARVKTPNAKYSK